MIMRTLITLFGVALIAPVATADNIANCEIILLQDIKGEASEGSMQVASYRSAVDFIASVYDEEDGHIRTVDDLAIRGLMCARNSVVPTLRDYPIVATGVPLSLSQNFESNTSGLMTVYFKDGEFQHQYSGPDLTQTEQAALEDALETFNLQPHDLGKLSKKKTPKIKAVEVEDTEVEAIEIEATEVEIFENETPEIEFIDMDGLEVDGVEIDGPEVDEASDSNE